MSWFRVDDKSAFHRKIVKVGNEAWGAICRAGAHSSGEGLDGFLSEEVAKLIGKPKIWQRGIDAGLIEKVEGGYQIHDFLDWNPSAAEVEEARAQLSEKRRKAGVAGAAKRWQGRDSGNSKPDGKPMASAIDGKMANGWPHPIPSHPNLSKRERQSMSEKGSEDSESEESVQGQQSLIPDAPGAEPTGKKDQTVSAVWAHYLAKWKAKVNQGVEPKLTKARKGHIRSRLQTYSEEQVIQAIDNLFADPFMCGANDRGTAYLSPEHVFGSDVALEKRLAFTVRSSGYVSKIQPPTGSNIVFKTINVDDL